MRTVIFVGPSISKTTAQEIVPDALILPPAEQGDVHFARHQLGADVIALIDGVHSQRLPPWHCEVLDVLQEGARFLGAASMGALRAVECAPWGAEPIGEIAQWYASGVIEGDDEVCLAHGDESTAWKAFSVPLVNVRATLKAVPSILLSAKRRQEILEVAKTIFYPERTWRRLADACELRDFDLEEYEINLKQADAMQLCYLLTDLPPRKKAERDIKNLRSGYKAVFEVNDAKILHHGKIHRLHEIAPDGPFLRRIGIERKLALEWAKMAGISAPGDFNPVLPGLDMREEDALELAREEYILAKARTWWSSSKACFGDVKAFNDAAKAYGIYEQRKECL